MGKKRKYQLETAKRPRDIPEYFQMLLEEISKRPSDYIVPPLNPTGFGVERPELQYKSPLVTGQILFDDPFYNVPPPPPLGKSDPTYPQWRNVVHHAELREQSCPAGKESPRCAQARDDYFEAARQYANALDRYWGLNRLQNNTAATANNKRKTRA